MITCPRCDTLNPINRIFCLQCGYYFSTHPFPSTGRAGSNFLLPRPVLRDSDQEEDDRIPLLPLDPDRIQLQLFIDGNEAVQLQGASEYIIGRTDLPGGWEPAVDLTPFGGEPGGVSRRHARIFIEDGQPYIEDIGSLNGTYINTVRLITRVPQPLRDRDQLLFGRVLVELRISPLEEEPDE